MKCFYFNATAIICQLSQQKLPPTEWQLKKTHLDFGANFWDRHTFIGTQKCCKCDWKSKSTHMCFLWLQFSLFSTSLFLHFFGKISNKSIKFFDFSMMCHIAAIIEMSPKLTKDNIQNHKYPCQDFEVMIKKSTDCCKCR